MNTNSHIFYTDDRDSDRFNAILEMIERLGWTSYPTNYDGEELDDMDGYPDDADEQTVELPAEDEDLWNIFSEIL